MTSPVLDAIHTRRSIRDFTTQTVEDSEVRAILEAGIWAPSGLNNQPWRFVVVRDAQVRARLAEQTSYCHIVLAAPVLIAVFLETSAMYDDLKDAQSAGAAIQNMLLATEAYGLGAVWLGQILKNHNAVRKILDLPESLQLMAVVAIGHPAHRDQKSRRKPLEEFLIKEL